jgi:branched-chain amino acid transport system substrate-binding protein
VVGGLFDYVVHEDSIQATQLAILEANREGGLDGSDFGLVVCDYSEDRDDDLTSIEASEQGARWLADVLGTSAIVGPRGSSRTLAAFDALEESDVFLISPSATSPELTTVDETSPTDQNPGLLWRTVAPDDLQATVIVTDLEDRGVTSLAIISQQGSYGDALSALIVDGFTAQVGDQVEVFSYSNSPGGAVSDAADSGVDEVVFVSSDIEDYVDFLNAAVANGNLESTYDGMGIFLTDGGFNEQLLGEDVDSQAEVLFDNIRGTRPAPAEGALFNTFSTVFAAEFGANPQSSGFTVHTYDAAWLVLYGLAWAHYNEGDEGGRSIARGLRHVSEGDSISIRLERWPDVIGAFERGDGIDVQGGSGDLDYDPKTEETTSAIQIWGIEETMPSEYDFYEIDRIG